MNVGFLILNFNSSELTRNLAEKVSKFEKINKVVIVDNCSTDDSYERLSSINEDRIDVMISERNGGYSYGNNYGAKYCKELGMDILFISNPDVDVEEEDVNKIIAAFRDSDYSVLSGVEYDVNKMMSQPPVWRQMSYKDDMMDCFFIGRKLCKAKKGTELNKNERIQRAELVKGSFLAVRLVDFLSVGGFDEGTFLFCEERILGKRMESEGKKIGIVTGAKYYHNHSVSINKAYRGVAKQIKLLYDSRLYFHMKYTQINPVFWLALKLAMIFSVTEYSIMDRVKAWRLK